MKWADVEKDWKAYRGPIKARWQKLTEADLDKIAGKRPTLVTMLKVRHDLEKPKAEEEIEAFLKTLKKPAPVK